MNEKHEAYGRNARHFASEHVSNSRLYVIFKEDLFFYRDKHEGIKSGIEGDKTQENEGLNYVGALKKILFFSKEAQVNHKFWMLKR